MERKEAQMLSVALPEGLDALAVAGIVVLVAITCAVLWALRRTR